MKAWNGIRVPRVVVVVHFRNLIFSRRQIRPQNLSFDTKWQKTLFVLVGVVSASVSDFFIQFFHRSGAQIVKNISAATSAEAILQLFERSNSIRTREGR